MSNPLEQVDLSISGMTCSSCVATVERALNKVPGAQAAVNLATESAHILVPTGTKSSTLIEAVSKAGYSAKLRTDESESFAYATDLGVRTLLAAIFTIPVVLLSMWHSVHMRVDTFLLTQLDRFGIPAPLYSPTGWLVIALSAPVVLLIAWPIHRAALRNLTHPTMDNLISLGSLTAFGWSIYANSTGAGDLYTEVAASVITLITLGRYLESRAKRRAGSSLAELLSLAPKQVTVLRGSVETILPILDVVVGDRCVVKPGERIPTDGVIVEGVSAVDNSLLTGESLPVEVKVGSEVIAGAINQGGRLVIESRRVGSDTELARITKMVLTAQTEKAPIQRLADRISSVFVPVVLLISALTLGGWIYLDYSVGEAVRAAVAVMVIACPCALGLATPVALLVATGRGAAQGIVLRRAASLEIAPEINTVIFDKTGTLTSGVMRVQGITMPNLGSNSLALSASEILAAIHTLESESTHPIAKAIATELLAQGVSKLPFGDLTESAGQGIAARVNFSGKQLPVLIGSPESIRRATVSLHADLESAISQARSRGRSVALVGIDGIACALIEVGDSLRTDSIATVKELQAKGITSWMVTGDSELAAHQVANEVGIPFSHVIANATPESKIDKVKELHNSGAKVLMIGDGVNDAAALAEADLSVAMGTGTDTAIASADITLMRPELKTLITALTLAKRTLTTIRGNLLWAFLYNVVLIPIAALGLLNPMYAGGAMATSSLFVVGNSLRLRR